MCTIDFSQNVIPAGAFGPGSDPFTGVVNFVGVGLGPLTDCPQSNVGSVHAVLERQGTIDIPVPGATSTVDVEMIAMHLVSSAPINVTFGGSKRVQSFDLHVRPVPPPPSEPWSQFEYYFDPQLTEGQAGPPELQQGKFAVIPSAPGSGDLDPILIEIASTIPVAVVQKGYRPGKEFVNCDESFCMHSNEPLVFQAPGFQISLDGACPDNPVPFEIRSWGSFKSVFRGRSR